MRFNVDYREEATGVLKGSKHYFLVGRVDFTEEEKAIIQQRGLYDEPIQVPTNLPPPTKSKDIRAMLLRIVGIILMPLGLLSYCAGSLSDGSNGSTTGGFIMLAIGIVCFGFGKFMDMESNKAAVSVFQVLTPRKLLTNPEFLVYGPDLQTAKGFELMVRDKLTEFANFIRDSAVVPEKNTYEL